MLRSKGFYGDFQLHSHISVDGNELVVLQLDYITVLFCDYRRYLAQSARLIRKKDRYSEYSVSHDETLTDDGAHGNNVHVTSGKDGNYALIFHIQMLDSSYCQQT